MTVIDSSRRGREEGTLRGRPSTSSRRGVRMLAWAERLLVTGGAAALGWCAYVLTDAYVTQWLARETLESASPSTSSSPSASRRAPAKGAPLAELSIPSVGLSAVVLHGSDAHTLQRGLGHLENTPLPGESGNVAIAGHRDSFF